MSRNIINELVSKHQKSTSQGLFTLTLNSSDISSSATMIFENFK